MDKPQTKVIATRSGQPAHVLFSGRKLTQGPTNREWLEERRAASERGLLARLFGGGR